MREFSRPVTVSIVSHGHWDEVQPLLHQLSTWCASSVDRVILTVNVPERVLVQTDLGFPVEVIRNSRPRGFGPNHNTAFNRHTTPWFLVLNPDIRIDHDILSSLLSRAERDAGVLAPRVLEPDCSEPEPYRMLVTPAELLRRRRRGHTPPAYPSWMAGMFLLLRSKAYAELRGFDERFFMYCEDVDLCVRLQLSGWKMQVATDSIVLHEAQRDSHSSIRPLLWHIASFFKLWTSEAFWRYLRLQKEWQELPTAPSVLLSEGRSVRGYSSAHEGSRLKEATPLR
jgi:N-acetylglucosaminyl-diphospho-decaprenol L-rhamnosyltransferase